MPRLQLIDFFRFGAAQVEQLYTQQPTENSTGTWNRVEYRPLEGFVFAVTPFKCVSPLLLSKACMTRTRS